jgi:DNA-binding response OmpR family regulator
MDQGGRDAGLILGADGYTTKPLEFDVLIAAMKSVLGLDDAGDKPGA